MDLGAALPSVVVALVLGKPKLRSSTHRCF